MLIYFRLFIYFIFIKKIVTHFSGSDHTFKPYLEKVIIRIKRFLENRVVDVSPKLHWPNKPKLIAVF